MILGGHQDTPVFEDNDYQGTTENQGVEAPPRDTSVDMDEPAPKGGDMDKAGDNDSGKGGVKAYDPIKAGNHFALMSFLHLCVVDMMANNEGNTYYTKKGKKRTSGNSMFKTEELFSEVPTTKPRQQQSSSLSTIFKFNRWCSRKRSAVRPHRLQAKKNPYNRRDGSKNDGDWSEYGLGYELIMVWHNLVFTSVTMLWMGQHFADMFYTPFVMSVKTSMLGVHFVYWFIFAMLVADAWDSDDKEFDGELAFYAVQYLILSLMTSAAQKVLAPPILDDYYGKGEYCDPEEDDDCCDPEEDSDCEYKKFDSDSDGKSDGSDDEDYKFDEDCKDGDVWCEGKSGTKKQSNDDSDKEIESGSEAEDDEDFALSKEEGDGF